MTGERLAQLMMDPRMKRIVARAARRYTKCIEDQEEYIDDAWVRISKCHDDASDEHLEREARRAVNAARMRRAYVQKKPVENLHGISEDCIKKYKRSDLMPLGRGRYLVLKPEKLSGWYYHKEWEDYGLPEDGIQVRTYYEIVVST